MRRVWMALAGFFAVFFCGAVAWADSGAIVRDTNFPVPAPVAYSSTFTLRTDGMGWASAQVVMTSATHAAATFTDGTASSTTFTVVSYTALSSATATGKITISNLGYLQRNGGCVSGGGPAGTGQFNVCTPQDFTVTTSTGGSACNLSAAINALSVIVTTCTAASSTGIVYTTATYPASVWNSFTMNSSSNTTGGALIVTQMSGGQDNQSITVNGTRLVANRDFYPLTSTAQTATNIATAITASSMTTGVRAAAGGSVVYATSTAVGTATNYAVATSSQAALRLAPFTTASGYGASGVMVGGTNSAYIVNTSTISTTNTFGLAEGVYLNPGSVTLSPLTAGTTYFVITNTALGSGKLMLATTKANALAGTPIVLTSSGTTVTGNSFSLIAPPIAGTPSFQWMVSNDKTNWMPLQTTTFGQTIPSVSYGTYYSTGSVNVFDFGRMNYGYLGIAVTAPTSGALNMNARVVGKE